MTEGDILKVRMFLVFAVDKLLMDSTLSKLKTVRELQELVRDIKFGKHQTEEAPK